MATEEAIIWAWLETISTFVSMHFYTSVGLLNSKQKYNSIFQKTEHSQQ